MAVVKGGSVKTLWMLGLVSLVLSAAYNWVAGGASEAAQGPGRPGAMPEPAFMVGSGGTLPASFPEYLFLHQTLHESIPVHSMVGVKTCPE